MKIYFIVFVFFISSEVFSEDKKIISITQMPCQFLEMEGKNLNILSKDESECAKINSLTLKDRNKMFQTLKLKRGEYTFRVTNIGIPYEVGFWLRGAGFSRLTLPATSGGGLHIGDTKDYSIDLKPGKYKISCPLNSTPDYDLIVED
jgi:hypothetical protein